MRVACSSISIHVVETTVVSSINRLMLVSITVAGFDREDKFLNARRATSNWGSCVDTFASVRCIVCMRVLADISWLTMNLLFRVKIYLEPVSAAHMPRRKTLVGNAFINR